MSTPNDIKSPLGTPAIGNVAAVTNFLGMGVLAFFLNGSATQQLNGLHEAREAVARIEVQVAGIDALRQELAALRKDLETVRESAATASELRALETRLAALVVRVEDVEACAADKRRCR